MHVEHKSFMLSGISNLTHLLGFHLFPSIISVSASYYLAFLVYFSSDYDTVLKLMTLFSSSSQ